MKAYPKRGYPKLPAPNHFGTEMLSFVTQYLLEHYVQLFEYTGKPYDCIYLDLGDGECLEVKVKLKKWKDLN